MPPANDAHFNQLTIKVPIVLTERLTLRAFAESDLDDYARMLSDPEVSRFVGDGTAIDRTMAWRQIAQILGHWALRGFGLWAAEERETGELVGRIGFLEPAGWPGFELAYTLRRSSWGRGYAREGGRAVLAYAHTVLGRRDVISVIRPENVPSIRVATALGAARAETVTFFGAPSDIYRYPPPLETTA